jgi:predicted Rossmann fold flavoprotein
MKIAIIGGGAAGLMAAATLCEQSRESTILLIEKNKELGKKVLISGGGRCNVTTGVREIRDVLSRYPRGGKFLNSAMRRFPPDEVFAWFEEHGVPLKIEDDLRVFPRSNNGHDIVGVFTRLFAGGRVETLLNHHAVQLEKSGSGFLITFKDGATLQADRVILTTGGQAFRHTGSTGDGYAFAEAMGHRVTPLAPSLNSFFTFEAWPKILSGLSFERARFTAHFFAQDYAFTGPFVFTHRGLSGPAVFALSSLVAFETYDARSPMRISIDLFPDQSEKEVIAMIEKSRRDHPKKGMGNLLDFFMPKSFAEIMLKQLALDANTRSVDMKSEQISSIVSWLKKIPLQVIGRGAGDEFVTAGGVDLAEIDQRTMQSKITPGLYFAGEIMDIDGFTGGYNLQASWATGRVAGESIAEES